MAINKVIRGDGSVIMDITDTVIDENRLPLGSVVYNASGERVNGTALAYNVYRDTTANWDAQIDYVPEVGDIIVYTDKFSIIKDGDEKLVPGIKMGEGNAYLIDLPFVTDAVAASLIDHINDTVLHVTQAERTSWNNKVNVDVNGEALVFSRN